LLKEIYESNVAWIVYAEIVPEPALNEDVGQICKSKKSLKRESLEK